MTDSVIRRTRRCVLAVFLGLMSMSSVATSDDDILTMLPAILAAAGHNNQPAPNDPPEIVALKKLAGTWAFTYTVAPPPSVDEYFMDVSTIRKDSEGDYVIDGENKFGDFVQASYDASDQLYFLIYVSPFLPDYGEVYIFSLNSATSGSGLTYFVDPSDGLTADDFIIGYITTVARKSTGRALSSPKLSDSSAPDKARYKANQRTIQGRTGGSNGMLSPELLNRVERLVTPK